VTDISNPTNTGTVSNVSFLDSSLTGLTGMAFVGYSAGPNAAEAYWDSVSLVPEPSAMVLLATGLMSLLFMAWRRRKRK